MIHDVVNNSLLKVKDYLKLMLNSYFPDNEDFNEEDCEFWENKLGLISSNSLSLQKRKEMPTANWAIPKKKDTSWFLSCPFRIFWKKEAWKQPGLTFGVFLILLFGGRFLVEFFKEGQKWY